MRRLFFLLLVFGTACAHLDYEKRIQRRFEEICIKSPFSVKEKSCNNASDYYSLGIAFFISTDVNKAMSCFQRARELDPREANYTCALAQGYYFLAIFDMVERGLFEVWRIIPNSVSQNSFQRGFLGFEAEAMALICTNTSLKKPFFRETAKEIFSYHQKAIKGLPSNHYMVPRVRFFPDENAALLLQRALTYFRYAEGLSGATNSVFTGHILDLREITQHLQFLLDEVSQGRRPRKMIIKE